MSCPNCDHTMQHINDGKPSTFWCPNCGTLKAVPWIEGFSVLFQELQNYISKLKMLLLAINVLNLH